MSVDSRLRVVLCWHMHQPQYQDAETHRYQLPWTYLHATKDYVDMAALLEQIPQARAVVNFAPTLLEQLDDYAEQISGFLAEGRPLRDPLLAALAGTAMPQGDEVRLSLVKACLRANRKRLIDPYPQFKLLADMAQMMEHTPASVHYLSDQFLTDLLVWYHLAWLGETVRREEPRAKALLEKGRDFNRSDRRRLVELIGELVGGIVERYRLLAQAGRVELATSPYAHPIVPLLINFGSAREAQPEMALPKGTGYPGGRERAAWHISHGNEVFRRHFGRPPAGCWPSEGSLSAEALALFQEAGYHWVASGESVLRHSLAASHSSPPCIHHPYRLEQQQLPIFFRDDGLSDLIGFTYSDWHADDAVNNLLHHLENIAHACAADGNRMVSIIMDGENAWEYYPANGYYFLSALYRRLADHPHLRLSTFSEALAEGVAPTPLPQLVAGSWVYGTFSTWVGDPEKNRAWELLIEAKQAFDRVVANGRLKGKRLKEAERQLAICEGSDWFWWMGDYNPAESVQNFDRLYRVHLANLYRLIGEAAPEHLTDIISHGGGTPEQGGVMRRGGKE